MPINLSNDPLSSIKLGESSILKGYVGEGQLFPNNTEITAAAFTNSSITNAGGNTPYVVSGAIGSSFDLIGSLGATAPTGTQVLSTTSQTYQIGIGDQSSTCGATQRNSQIVITPQGNSVLASGLSNTDTISQAQGPQNSSNTTSVSCVVTNSSRVTASSRWRASTASSSSTSSTSPTTASRRSTGWTRTRSSRPSTSPATGSRRWAA